MAMDSKKPDFKEYGLGRLIRAFNCSMAGLRSAVKYETAFQQELLLCILLVPLGLWFGHTGTERALLVGSLFLVLIVELLNSALEAVVDRISTEQHPLSGKAKDLGSAAVLIALANLVVVWSCIIL